MFGSSTPQQSSGGLFGSSTPQQQSSGGLFGSSSTTQPSSLFGSSTPQQQNTGGLFGSNNATQQSSGGLFGSSTPQQQNSGGGLFGTTSQQSSGGLFGNTQQQNSGGLFGNNQQQQQQQNSGGLFGNTQQQSSGGLFGNSQQQQQNSGGLFGNTQQQSSGGLFGNTQQQQQPNSGGLFGNTQQQSSGGLFGNTQQQSSGGLFGNTQQQQQPNSGGLFGNNQQFTQQQQQVPSSAPWWYRELKSIQDSYRPGPASRFQTMLYEVVGNAPELVVHSGAVAPAHIDNIKAQRKREVLQLYPWIDEREWQRAEDKNPDPINWMPSPLIGIDALYSRVELQAAYIRAQLDMLIQPPGKYNSIQSQQPQQQQQQLAIANKEEQKEDNYEEQPLWLRLEVGEPQEAIERCRHEHVRLKHRFIQALGRLERLQSSSLGGGRSADEVRFEQEINRIHNALTDASGCRAQLTSLVTQMELEDYQNSRTAQGEFGANGSSFSEQDQVAIFNFLELQREGIDNLIKIVKRDMRDLDIIKRKIGEA